MNKKAAIIIIGNEILSGRTRDANAYWLAKELFALGILVKKCSFIADEMESIVSEVQFFAKKYDYVFVCGGIGTTPDDITRQALAAAFELPCEEHAEASSLLLKFFGSAATPRRMTMATLPRNAKLIYNPVNVCPGFKVENVFVFPGIPNLVEKMFSGIVDQLERGDIFEYEFVTTQSESEFADLLEEALLKFPTIDLGSYPVYDGQRWTATVVIKSHLETELNATKKWLLEAFNKRKK